MELAGRESECKIERIKAAMACPRNFHCQKSGFKDLAPVVVYQGANAIQCKRAHTECPKASVLQPGNVTFCMCPLRKHLALRHNL